MEISRHTQYISAALVRAGALSLSLPWLELSVRGRRKEWGCGACGGGTVWPSQFVRGLHGAITPWLYSLDSREKKGDRPRGRKCGRV